MSHRFHLLFFIRSVKENLYDWQSLSPTSGPGSAFFTFCDALEVKDGVNAPEGGWGVDHALAAWSDYFANTYLAESKSTLIAFVHLQDDANLASSVCGDASVV